MRGHHVEDPKKKRGAPFVPTVPGALQQERQGSDNHLKLLDDFDGKGRLCAISHPQGPMPAYRAYGHPRLNFLSLVHGGHSHSASLILHFHFAFGVYLF